MFQTLQILHVMLKIIHKLSSGMWYHIVWFALQMEAVSSSEKLVAIARIYSNTYQKTIVALSLHCICATLCIKIYTLETPVSRLVFI